MRSPSLTLSLLLSSLVVTALGAACPGGPAAEGEGEAGEGEGDAGGEGEGDAGGEGEGDAGGEGEGDAGGEGEGDTGSEGEGEGDGSGGAGAACTNDSFCAAGLACGFAAVNTTTPPHLETQCVTTPTTGSAVGTPCQDASQCAFNLCEDNLCSAPCSGPGDCADSQVCTTTSFTVDGVGGILPVCKLNGDAPATPCADDSQCTSTNRLCNDLVNQDPNNTSSDLVLQCGFPGAGGALGAACASDFLEDDTQCVSGLCDGDTAGVCTAACNDNSDCGSFVCTGSGFTNVPGQLCAQLCFKEADCAQAGRSCQLRDNAVSHSFDQVCTQDDGANSLGFKLHNGACVQGDGATCQAGFAVDNGTVCMCSAICTAVGDCAVTADATHVAPSSCGTVHFTKPASIGGGTQDVSACLP